MALLWWTRLLQDAQAFAHRDISVDGRIHNIIPVDIPLPSGSAELFCDFIVVIIGFTGSHLWPHRSLIEFVVITDTEPEYSGVLCFGVVIGYAVVDNGGDFGGNGSHLPCHCSWWTCNSYSSIDTFMNHFSAENHIMCHSVGSCIQ